MKNTFLAINLGTVSGSAILGELTDGILSLREIHRFDNEPVFTEGHGFWNIEMLFQEIKKSLSIVADNDLPVESIGIDSWSVDFSFVGDDGIPSQPFIHQDAKNDGMVEAFTSLMSTDKIYGQTGIRISQTNSLFQLLALKRMGYEPLKKAKHLLFMPDVFNYLLTGVIQTEFSIAATSQLYNPVKRLWDRDIMRVLVVPVAIMPRVAEPGSVIGSISNNVSYETGIARIPVIAVASHDLGSSIASIPATGNNWAFIHTDSLCHMGFESPTAIITKKTQQLLFSNEGGAGHTFRVQKNLTGLRLLEECRKVWNDDAYTLAGMLSLAEASKPFAAFIDTDHISFLNPENMPAAITAFCESTGQYVPQTHGEIIRTILEGLAFKFRVVAGLIESIRGLKPDTLYMAGEGIQYELLCRFTADSCGIPVIATMEQATSAGNIMVQAMALGIVKNVAEIREITGKSFPSKRFEPADREMWSDAYEKYQQITGSVL